LPGIDIRVVPALDTARAASREIQVDVVVATLLNGMASPDTRAVLVSGEHPMLASAGKDGIPDVAAGAAAAATESPSDMSERGNRNPGGRNGARQGRVIGNLPPMAGLQQIVGLALGSPEFQRR
jgi:hypothetical protein